MIDMPDSQVSGQFNAPDVMHLIGVDADAVACIDGFFNEEFPFGEDGPVTAYQDSLESSGLW